MTSRQRKIALTAHVISSIGWFGAVAAFLALAVTGMTSQDAQRVRAAYLAMQLATWFVIVPLAFISLLIVLTVLSVYKPRGMTVYGIRKQHEQHALSKPEM